MRLLRKDTLCTPVEALFRGIEKSKFGPRPNQFPRWTKIPLSPKGQSYPMEDGPGARANLAKAAVALTVLSLLPVALSGYPSHASTGLRPISFAMQPESSAGVFPWSSPLFAAFRYDRGQVLGTYVQFAYDASTGTMKSILGLAGNAPVLYVGSIRIGAFAPSRGAHAIGSTFEAQGYLVTITAHDDPTVLIEIRTDVARTATIELPAGATNVSLQTAPGSWPASSVSYSVGDEQARFLLGAGTFSVNGIQILAKMADSDLLLFKSVPPLTANRAEWLALLDAIGAGHIVAELDLVATTDGQWVHNVAQYRIGVAGWALAVQPGRAAIQVDSLLLGGAVVLLAFDTATMPFNAPTQLRVRANAGDVNRTESPLSLFLTNEMGGGGASYSVLSFPGTVVALYLPSLAAMSVEVVSTPPAASSSGFQAGSEVAMIAALAIVSVAAPRMLRRRGP